MDGQSELNWKFLDRRWGYLKTADGEPLISLPEDFNWAKLAKRYGEALQSQALSDPELRELVQARASLRTAKAVEDAASGIARVAGPDMAFDLARYAQSVVESYCYLKFGSLDPEWTQYERRVRLETVYVPQSVKQALPPRDLTRDYLSFLKEKGVELLDEEVRTQKDAYGKMKAVPGTRSGGCFESNNRVVILGDPGLGKSTLLRYLLDAMGSESCFSAGCAVRTTSYRGRSRSNRFPCVSRVSDAPDALFPSAATGSIRKRK